MTIFQEYSISVLKTIFFYLVVIFALRTMGKREVGEISVFDIVIFLVISELLALSISEVHISVFKSLVPISFLIILQILTSYLSLKFKKLRDLIEGKPSILMVDGSIDIKEMKKQRYNIDDLLMQLRDKDIDDLNQVKYAILENSGNLNVIKKSSNLVYPFPLIMDGCLVLQTAKELNIEVDLFKQELKNRYGRSLEEIFICMVYDEGYYIMWNTLKQNE